MVQSVNILDVTNDANDALIASWLLSLHDKAANTRRQYEGDVRRFAQWLEGDLLDVDRRTIEKWFASLSHLAQNTRHARWIALRSFYNWAHDEEEIDANPMAKIRVGRGDEPPPNVLSREEIASLLAACKGKDFLARRDLALVRYFLATGIRLHEALLNVGDVDLAMRRCTFVGKGAKERTVRFDAGTAQALDRYLRVRARHKHARRPELWLGLQGAMTSRGITVALEKRGRLAGIEDFHTHRLRHSFAHYWKLAGGSEESLMMLGGWSDPKVMQRYGSRQRVDRALAAYDDIDPLAGL